MFAKVLCVSLCWESARFFAHSGHTDGTLGLIMTDLGQNHCDIVKKKKKNSCHPRRLLRNIEDVRNVTGNTQRTHWGFVKFDCKSRNTF